MVTVVSLLLPVFFHSSPTAFHILLLQWPQQPVFLAGECVTSLPANYNITVFLEGTWVQRCLATAPGKGVYGLKRRQPPHGSLGKVKVSLSCRSGSSGSCSDPLPLKLNCVKPYCWIWLKFYYWLQQRKVTGWWQSLWWAADIIPQTGMPEESRFSWASAISWELDCFFVNKKCSIVCISSCDVASSGWLIYGLLAAIALGWHWELCHRLVFSMRKIHSYIVTLVFCKINQRNGNVMKHRIQNRLIYFNCVHEVHQLQNLLKGILITLIKGGLKYRIQIWTGITFSLCVCLL